MSFEVDLDRVRRRQTVKWTLYGPDVLAAWVAELDFDVAPPVRAAIVDAVDREDFGYVVADLSGLVEACAQFLHAQHEWTVSPARIFPVADILSGIRGALELGAEPGAGVVVPTPAYPPFFEIVALTGRPVVQVPMIRDASRFVLDLDAIEHAFTAGARTLLLCNPHNPTGRVFSVAECEALAAVVDRHGARVVSDEVHAPLVYAPNRHVPYASVSDATAAHTITVTAASKAFNIAGLKCAQVIATNREDATRWRTRGVFEVPGPIPIGVAASIAAYTAGGVWLHELMAVLGENRTVLAELLPQLLPDLPADVPEATFLAWLDCSALGSDDPAALFLEQSKVALSAGGPFGSGWEHFVRLNFGTSAAVLDRIVRQMQRIAT